MNTYPDKENEYLGQGIAFPIHLNPSGKVGIANGEEDIEQAIQIILGTIPGERLMRPEFGCRVHELLFAPNDLATEELIIYYIEEALERWEPRIEVQAVKVTDQLTQDGALQIEIYYQIQDTHNERSIVYPFFLMGPEE